MITRTLLHLALAITFLPVAAWSAPSAPAPRPSHPQVILAWDNSGDFGPQTPGTQTDGWQEALNYCVANARDLYVKGGWGGRKPIYNIHKTIHIPATQDFRIDGGIYVLNWTGAPDDPNQDLMDIDSTMNGEYHFGIFVYGGAGAALRIKPEHPVPIDGFPVVVETEIKSQGMADPHPFTPGERKAGAGLIFDGTKAPIVSSRFDFIGGILNFRTCVETHGVFRQNHFNCLHLHTNADKSTLFRIGKASAQNVFSFVIGVDMGAKDVNGIDISGFNNQFQINTRGGFPKGHDIILEPPARGNRIALIQGRPDFTPADFITDHAENPSNRLTWTGGNIPIQTVPVTPGTFHYTQRLFPAVAHVRGGAITTLQVARGDSTVDYSTKTPVDILLDVGDTLHIASKQPPMLKLSAFQVP